MANVLETSMNYLQTQDPEVAACIENEFQRQKQNIELIASENIASPAVIAAMGSVLTNKYAEGYPGKRYYGGCDYVDVLETIAIERAKKLFGAAYANVQPHSGAQANLEVYAALLQPGDTLMGMDLASGGHLTHGARVNLSGKYYHSISYGVDPETGRIDYDQVEDMVRRYRPKLLVAGASAYPRAIDFKAFAEIAHKNGALLMVDMAHIAGLVAGGQHMSPVPYADVVTTTTHKTLRGPRGGMILSRDEEFAKKLNSAVFPGTQGGPLMHVIAGKAVCLREAAQPAFKVYAENVVKNAKALAAALLMDLTYLAFRYAQTSLYQISYQAPSSVSSETPVTATTVSVGMVMRTSLLVDGAVRTFTSFVVAMLSAFGVMASSCTSAGHLAVSRSGVPPRWLEAKMDATVQLLLVTSMATCPL